MNLKKITFFLVILVVGFSCKKESNNPNIIDGIDVTELPPATMNGANTMGCLINGEIWLPLTPNISGKLVYDISFDVSSPGSGGGVTVSGQRDYDDFYDGMQFVADDIITTGIYEIPAWASFGAFWRTQCGFFEMDSTFSNTVEITRIDYENEIVSGFYKMRVISQECDTLTITEGRFDLSP